MRMLLIVYGGPNPQRLASLLETHRVKGYTEVEHARGAGASGRREGTRAWPGDSTVFFSIVPDERVDELETALREEAAHLEADDGSRLHVAILPVERFF